MIRSEKLDQLLPALAEFQAEMCPVLKGSENTFHKSKYADLVAVWEQARPLLKKNGLAVLQPTGTGEGGTLIVETFVFHVKSGQFVSGTLQMPLSKVDPQGVGSAITYARRYGLQSLLEIVAQDEDDDGEAAQGHSDRPSDKGRPAQAPAASAPPAGKSAAELAAEGTGSPPEMSPAEKAAVDPLVQATLDAFPGSKVDGAAKPSGETKGQGPEIQVNDGPKVTPGQVGLIRKKLRDRGIQDDGAQDAMVMRWIGFNIVNVPKHAKDLVLNKINEIPAQGGGK